MPSLEQPYISWVVAIGIGLLIGAERERRKGEGPQRRAAGIRTFSITALLGAAVMHLGGTELMSVAAAGLLLLTAIAYLRTRSDDPGLTTEIALVLTLVLGGLAVSEPEVAAPLAVIVTVLLAARTPLQSFVRETLTEAELRSALIFAAATLVVWPVLPNRYLGPFEAINPRSIWSLVIFIMAISACGYMAVRLLGSKHGLPLAGLASGFVSSSATIAAMGARAAEAPQMLVPAVAGAVLSTVATVIQMALIVAATSPATVVSLALPMLCAGVAALGYGLYFGLRMGETAADFKGAPGDAFDVKTALVLAAMLAVILFATAALRAWLGDKGMALAAGLAGFADVHAPVASVASQVAAGRLGAADAVLPAMLAFTTNSITKIVLAVASGARDFAFRVVPGIILVLAAGWIGVLVR